MHFIKKVFHEQIKSNNQIHLINKKNAFDKQNKVFHKQD